MQNCRCSLLFLSEIRVARGKRQTGFFAHDRQYDYFRVESQVADHSLEHCCLLRILLTKERDVRPHGVEQNRDYCGHAAKMTLPRRAFELFRQSLDGDVS